MQRKNRGLMILYVFKLGKSKKKKKKTLFFYFLFFIFFLRIKSACCIEKVEQN